MLSMEMSVDEFVRRFPCECEGTCFCITTLDLEDHEEEGDGDVQSRA